MKISSTLRFSCALLLSSFAGHVAGQTTQPADSTKTFKGVQFADKKATALVRDMQNKQIPLWAGLSLSANLAGAILTQTTSYGEYELGLRGNFRNAYFPTIEGGLGKADATGESSNLHYSTASPFARIGLDYNVKKDRKSYNRVFVGLRYGFSPFQYSLTGPELKDAYWSTTTPFAYTNIKSQAHWGEALFGLEAQIWKGIHLGWTLRYKLRICEKQDQLGHAYYIPGYGKNGSTSFGGTFNLIFDLTLLGNKKISTSKR